MARYGKPDATGRSSGIHSGRLHVVHGPPAGIPWCWVTREILLSPAWRALSHNTRKLIDFLFIEHCNHAGQENGRLRATYDQLEEYGLTRELISSSIDEAIGLGFLKTGPRLRRIATEYGLTFYASFDHTQSTNEWRKITSEDAENIKLELNMKRRRKKKW
jgi:hypothetical protein